MEKEIQKLFKAQLEKLEKQNEEYFDTIMKQTEVIKSKNRRIQSLEGQTKTLQEKIASFRRIMEKERNEIKFISDKKQKERREYFQKQMAE